MASNNPFIPDEWMVDLSGATEAKIGLENASANMYNSHANYFNAESGQKIQQTNKDQYRLELLKNFMSRMGGGGGLGLGQNSGNTQDDQDARTQQVRQMLQFTAAADLAVGDFDKARQSYQGLAQIDDHIANTAERKARIDQAIADKKRVASFSGLNMLSGVTDQTSYNNTIMAMTAQGIPVPQGYEAFDPTLQQYKNLARTLPTAAQRLEAESRAETVRQSEQNSINTAERQRKNIEQEGKVRQAQIDQEAKNREIAARAGGAVNPIVAQTVQAALDSTMPGLDKNVILDPRTGLKVSQAAIDIAQAASAEIFASGGKLTQQEAIGKAMKAFQESGKLREAVTPAGKTPLGTIPFTDITVPNPLSKEQRKPIYDPNSSAKALPPLSPGQTIQDLLKGRVGTWQLPKMPDGSPGPIVRRDKLTDEWSQVKPKADDGN